MSTDCIQCVKNQRTGMDLLCDECRFANMNVKEQQFVWELDALIAAMDGDPLTLMNKLLVWNNPPAWEVRWAGKVGRACQVAQLLKNEVDRLMKLLAEKPATPGRGNAQ